MAAQFAWKCELDWISFPLALSKALGINLADAIISLGYQWMPPLITCYLCLETQYCSRTSGAYHSEEMYFIAMNSTTGILWPNCTLRRRVHGPRFGERLDHRASLREEIMCRIRQDFRECASSMGLQ